MISFEKPSELKLLNEEELEYLDELKRDIEESLLEDCELKFAISDFCLIARIFDLGHYSFIFPIALSERGDEKAALLAANEYAMREEIERVFTDVPKECLPLFFEDFRHLDIDALDTAGDTFRVKIKSECELLSEIPEISFDEISLGEILDSEAELYAKLILDEKTNEFFGYDVREDLSENAAPEAFPESARLDFMRGSAITLAVRVFGEFSGEVTLYAFDGMGGAEFAIRLLPEKAGRGFGKLSFAALSEYARRIGLTRILAFVDKRNAKSLKYCAALMEKIEESDTRVKFSCDLY